MRAKIDSIVCIYLANKDSGLLEAFYRSVFGKIILSDNRYKAIEVYSDSNISSSQIIKNKLFLNTAESYSKLSLKTYEMIRFLCVNYEFSRIVKIDVTCIKYLQDNFKDKSINITSDMINELLLQMAPYKDYDGIFCFKNISRKDMENWAIEKNGQVELDKIFGNSSQVPSWFSGKCYSISFGFANYIAENGQEMANQHAQYLWGSEDVMIGRLYEKFKNYVPPPLNAFLEHIINLGGIKRVLWIGLPDKLFATSIRFVDHIYIYDPNLSMNYESFRKQFSDLYNKDIDDNVIEVNFQKSFSIPADLLKDSLIVCLDLFDLLIEPRHLIKYLAKIRLNSNYMVITSKDRLITNGYNVYSTNKLHSICPRWSAENFFQLLIDNDFPANMFFGHVTRASSLVPKDTTMALLGREVEPVLFQKIFKVAAIIHIFNEADIIESVVNHLVSQDVEVHVFDNWSDDGSYEICQKLLDQQFIKNLEKFPQKKNNYYEWAKQIQHTEKYAKELDANWIIHYDADEIRSSPWPDLNLNQAIQFVDSLGYNTIDFTVIDFRFTDLDEYAKFLPSKLMYFEFAEHLPNFQQIKAWKNQKIKIDLHTSGGHEVVFDGRTVYPIKFLTKHYSLRNKDQAKKKIFNNRLSRFQKEKAERGWHTQYDYYLDFQEIFPWSKEKLYFYNQYFFNDEFLIERLSGCGLRKLNYQSINEQYFYCSLEYYRKEILRLKRYLYKADESINSILNSNSWKLTRPLRATNQFLNYLYAAVRRVIKKLDFNKNKKII